MKLSDLWSPMSDLSEDQQDVSNTVVGLSSALLGIVMVASMPLPAQAVPGGRMSGYDLPQRPAPAPAPVAPAPQRPAPTYTPAPPAPAPVQYGSFRAYGPLPAGRVNVRVDGSFENATIWGYNIQVQDNGAQGNDQMIIFGPEGREQVWINCWVTQEWRSFGPNSEDFIHGVVSTYCDWNEGES